MLIDVVSTEIQISLFCKHQVTHHARYYNFLSNRDPYLYHGKTCCNGIYLRRKVSDLWIDNVEKNDYLDYDDELF